MDILKTGEKSKYIDWYRGISLSEYEKIEIPVLQVGSNGRVDNVHIENDPRKEDFNSKKPSYFSIWNGKYKFPITHPVQFQNSTIDEMIESQPHYRLVNFNKRPNYTCWFEFFEIPELNAENPKLKEHLFECAKKWIRLGVDGFRLDVPDMLNDSHKFWVDFRVMVNEEIKKLGKKPQDFYILGEIWSNDEITNSFLNSNPDSYPKRFDAIMNYPIREVVINFLSGEILEPRSDRVQAEDEITVSELDEILHRNFENISFNTDKVQFNCFSTHDTRRLKSVFPDMKMLKTAISMQFTLIGAPTIYYGDEIGLKGGVDPDNRGTMNWNIVKDIDNCPKAKEIFEHYKMLIQMRKSRKALSQGLMLTLLVDDEREIYAYSRFSDNGDCVIVVISKNDVYEDIVIDLSDTPFEYTRKWKSAFDNSDFINLDGKIIISPDKIADNNLILLN
jgi:glycosidase